MKTLLRLNLMLMVLLIVVGCCNHRKSLQVNGETTTVELVDTLMGGDWLAHSFDFFSIKYPSDWVCHESQYPYEWSYELVYHLEHNTELYLNHKEDIGNGYSCTGINLTLQAPNAVSEEYVNGERVNICGQILLDTLRTPEYWRDFFIYTKQFDSEYVSVIDDCVVDSLTFASYPAAMAAYIIVTENGDTLKNKQLTVLVDKKVLYYINNQYAWQDKDREVLGDSILSTIIFNDDLFSYERFNCAWKTYEEYDWESQGILSSDTSRRITSRHWEDSKYYGKIVRGNSTRLTDRPITIPTGKIMGHGYVDLGLSVKWATCNIYSSTPWVSRSHFKWGDNNTNFTFDPDTCGAYKKETGDISGDPRYDVARAEWGGHMAYAHKGRIQRTHR